MMSGRLLAKSKPKHDPVIRDEVTLIGHTACVLAAVDALFGPEGSPARLASSWLRFFGLDATDFDRFRRHLRVSAAAHDWGKANDGFQDAVTGAGEQVVRHEHLSGLLLAEVLDDEKAPTWLRDAGLDEGVVLAAVVSHHVKVARESPLSENERILGALVSANDGTLRIQSDHPDFEKLWRKVQDEVGSPCPATIVFPARWRIEELQAKSVVLRRKLDKLHSRLRDDPVRRRWVAAVRSGLIVADAVGSAVVRFDRDRGETALEVIDRWIGRCFSTTLTGKEVWENVTEKRIEELRAKGRWDDRAGHEFEGTGGFSRFQCEVAALGRRVLLTAACGSGKTLAAWNWIKAQLDARPPGRPLSRVLFLYPTRATATEGFRDYVSWAPGDEAGLLSGTSDYELRDMFDNPADPEDARKGRKYRSDPRLFALGHWSKRIFSATADQFFPFMQYGYSPLCLLPLLVESVLVVDEVHSFDRSMFNTLRRFLEEFPEVPVLCMTATLSEERRNELIRCKLIPYSDRASSPEDAGSDSEFPRYRVKWVDREEAGWLIAGALVKKKRVLRVSNRVADCQAAFQEVLDACQDDEFTPEGETTAFCYHGRFKLDDRKVRHKELIAAFQDAVREGAEPRAVFGSTTQVCEMSLDLDAEVLVTDLAPIASLIQRMGRCDRDSKKMRGRPIGRVYVLRPEPGREKPYEKEELDLAKRFVDELDGRDVSQVDLERLYKECDPGADEPKKLCPFLDSGPYADGKEDSFRDIDEFTVPAILDGNDLREVLAILRERDPAKRRPIDGFIVPVPRHLVNQDRPESSSFPRWLSVASQSLYGSIEGFREPPRSNKEG